MNLAKLDSISACEKGKWLTILTPNGVPTDISIKLMGVDAKGFKEQSLAIRKYTQSVKDKGRNIDDKAMDEKSWNMLAALTLDWKNVTETKDDKEVAVKCSLTNAKQVYESVPLIADQVASFVADRSNFLEM